MRIGAISPEQVDSAWELLEPLITPALEYDRNYMPPEEVRFKIRANEYACLVVIDDDDRFIAVQTAQVVSPPYSDRFLNLVTTAGDRLEEWQDLLADAIEELAKNLECKYIRTRGRPGATTGRRRTSPAGPGCWARRATTGGSC